MFICICIKNDTLTLSCDTGKELCFPCQNKLRDITTNIAKKRLTASFGGKKRLDLLIPDAAITNPGAKLSEKDIILSDENMDTVFNIVSVGTKVVIV